MVDLNAAVQDAHHGFRTAARMVIVGMVLLCGGSKEQAKEVADSEKAKDLVSGQVSNLREFARMQIEIIKTRRKK